MTASPRLRTPRRAAALGLAAACLVALSGCGSGDGPAKSGDAAAGLPSTVSLLSVRDLTGATAFAGKPTLAGTEVAIEQINAEKFLGDTKLVVDSRDAASTPQTAASLVTDGIAGGKYAAILGPIVSPEAQAVGPIAQKAKVPVVFTQSGAPGVLVGDYTFRATTSFASYYDVMGEYLQKKGVKTLGVIVDTGIGTYVSIVDTYLPKWKDKYGITVVDTRKVQATTKDFAAPVSALLSKKPDAIAELLVSTPNGTFVSQVRQAGFTGQIIASNGAGAGNLTGAGAAAKGVAWPVNWDPSQTNPESTKFVELFKAKFPGEQMSTYAAEGYDATWLVARAIKQANGADPTKVQQALDAITKTGFTGAQGHIAFEGHDARTTPQIVEWDGQKPVLVSS